MYAPPPLQLTTAQIERLKLESLARQQESDKRNSTESKRSTSPDTKALTPAGFTGTSPRKAPARFGKNSRSKATRNISAPLPLSSATQADRQVGRPQTSKTLASLVPGTSSPTPSFATPPRKAPHPPTRPPRPPSPLLIPPRQGVALLPSPLQHQQISPPPPPVPEKESKHDTQSPLPPSPRLKQPLLDDAILNEVLSGIGNQIATEKLLGDRQGVLSASGTEKASPPRKNVSFNTLPTKQSPPGVKRRSSMPPMKIAKMSGRKGSNMAALEALYRELDYPGTLVPPGRRTDKLMTSLTDQENDEATSIARQSKQNGEAINQLVDAGFFAAAKDPQPDRNGSTPADLNLSTSSYLTYVNKELPTTPNTVGGIPTELLHLSPSLPPTPKRQKLGGYKRHPLHPVQTTQVKLNNNGHIGNQTSDGSNNKSERLFSIPETSSLAENSPPPASNSPAPFATQLHLRTGSVVIYTPPEFTAWERHVYIPGPIKLVNSELTPRKNSVASLEAFQEAVDQVYQHALFVPRRKSDDAVVQGVLEWFEGYGFESVSFGGDTLAVDLDEGYVREMDELEGLPERIVEERFTTSPLPVEAVANPASKTAAKEVSSTPAITTTATIQPAPNEEMLRAKGIACVSHKASHSVSSIDSTRRISLTLEHGDEHVAFSSPRSSPTGATKAGSAKRSTGDTTDIGGMDWDDGVVEMDEMPTWVAPALMRTREMFSRGAEKMRRQWMGTVGGAGKSVVG